MLDCLKDMWLPFKYPSLAFWNLTQQLLFSISRQSDKLLRKLERQDKRRGRAPDPDLEWLIANQTDALQILAGLEYP